MILIDSVSLSHVMQWLSSTVRDPLLHLMFPITLLTQSDFPFCFMCQSGQTVTMSLSLVVIGEILCSSNI